MRKDVFLLLLGISLSISNPVFASQAIRRVEVNENQVVLIKTALGYSTIIEFTSKPISAVLGDQDAFKLEFVKNSITVKPLLRHASSNLFVFTEYDRFNCTLKTVSPKDVDYLVRVSSPKGVNPVRTESTPTPQGRSQGESKTLIQERDQILPSHKLVFWKGYSLRIISSQNLKGSTDSSSVTVYEFELQSKKDPYSFSAASLGVKQGSRWVPIERVYIDSLDLKPGHPAIRGKIVLLNQDFRPRAPVSIIFAVPGHSLEVTIPGILPLRIQKGK